MKNRLLIFLSFITLTVYSQANSGFKLGVVTRIDLETSVYEKDSTANALVLYESSNRYISEKHDYNFKTDYFFRIKIFNENAYDLANVSIPLYGDKFFKELKAISYNLESDKITKTYLSKTKVFIEEVNPNLKVVKFTLPNLKPGTIIEYQYSVISSSSTIYDWYFQSDIPKLKSDFTVSYVSNYKYNTKLMGFLDLKRKEVSVDKNCIYIQGFGRADCVKLHYGIDSIPAFVEEDYMMSKENYLSRLSFDLISFTTPRGNVRKFSETWKNIDKRFEKDFLGYQIKREKFFVKQLPEQLIKEKDPLIKSQKIYQFIQKRFNWNDKYWAANKINVKAAYMSRLGSVDEINLSLYNSLKAAGIESYLVLLATRDLSLPTKLYPILSDFNYMVVKTVINGKTYFLDATDDFIPFGYLPVRCLNGQGRVMDFENGSYWEDIKPLSDNSTKMIADISFDENLIINAKINVQKKGYFAYNDRISLSNSSEDSFLRELSKNSFDYEIEDYIVKNKENINKPLYQNLLLLSDDEFNTKRININPYLYFSINKNPFKFKERNYPVDYAYPRSYSYVAKLQIPEGYRLLKAPKQEAFSLPNNGGVFMCQVKQNNNVLSINYRFNIKKTIYSSEEYLFLKEFYNRMIKVFASRVELQKI